MLDVKQIQVGQVIMTMVWTQCFCKNINGLVMCGHLRCVNNVCPNLSHVKWQLISTCFIRLCKSELDAMWRATWFSHEEMLVYKRIISYQRIPSKPCEFTSCCFDWSTLTSAEDQDTIFSFLVFQEMVDILNLTT